MKNQVTEFFVIFHSIEFKKNCQRKKKNQLEFSVTYFITRESWTILGENL